jgi:hypothetical protein
VSERDLEHAVTAALRDLPEPEAPATLLPRVMAAVHAREQRPWYAQPWPRWSPLHQVTVVTACLLILVAAITFAAPALSSAANATGAQTMLGPLIDFVRSAQNLLSVVTTIAATAGTLWQRLCGPLVIYAALLVVLLGGAIGMLGTALHHFTQQRALTS